MNYARIERDTVLEIIESDDIDRLYHPDFIKELVLVDDSVAVGMIKDGDIYRVNNQQEPIIEKLRADMVLSAVNARLKLSEKGLLLRILEFIAQLPNDNAMKIKWEYSINLNRTDPDLVDFCKQTLGMSDEQMDEFFTG